ncbi:invasin, partial [Salmonella enterica]
TLKDAADNAVTGASSSLTADAVKVPNAALKIGSSWTDNGDGTYTATYVAETVSADNRATLALSGWGAPQQSEAYAITAAAPDQANSAIKTDATTYASGADMTVTVTLKDAADNAVTGASSSLTADAVKVPNAALKIGSSWTDNGDGTYTATYVAETVSADNRATLALSGWGAPQQSEAYAITAAAPDQAKSAIATDKASYASGADMTVTVTLKDAADNAVTGASSSLTVDAVKVPNAALKIGSSWTDNGDGTYTARYVAETVSADNRATLALSGWGAPQQSEAYAITAAAPDQAKSAIAIDKASYESGAYMTVTVTLKDKNGTVLTGDAGLLTSSTVKVPNALKTGFWRDNGDGTYTAARYLAETVSADNRATLALSGWGAPQQSEAYAITYGDEAPASINTQADAYTFTQTSEEGTFPTTGFTGATFTIVPKDGRRASRYTWKSDASWVSVVDGVVTFTGTGTGSKVTITGTPNNRQGNIIKYSFTLSSWFINSGSTIMTWPDANAYCSSQSGYSQPTVAQISLHNDYTATETREIGALWNEWGSLSVYNGSGFTGYFSWSSELRSSGSHYYVDLSDGYVINDFDRVTVYAVCRRGL